jgi:hypothetical protein
MITLINTNITRTKQTKHIKDKAKAITVTEVFKKILEAIIALEAVTVFKEIKAITDISRYLYVRKSDIFIIN